MANSFPKGPRGVKILEIFIKRKKQMAPVANAHVASNIVTKIWVKRKSPNSLFYFKIEKLAHYHSQ